MWDVTPLTYSNTTQLHDKINYDSRMDKLVVRYNGKTIFMKKLDFCNQNGRCEPGENYLSCSYDCPLNQSDGICLKEADGVCDPDCLKGVDPDCKHIKKSKTEFCGNHICDSTETYFSCPSDCPSGSDDGYCDKQRDGICDPDCLKKEDPDCTQTYTPKKAEAEGTNNLRVIIGSLLFVFVLVFFVFIIVRIKKQKVGQE